MRSQSFDSRTQALTMARRMTRALLAVAGLLASHTAWAVLPDMPAEVADFMEQRANCDRFRSEKVDARNVTRAKEVADAVRQFCTGTDGKLQDLKKIYAGNQPVMSRLNEYDVKVEPVDR
ncbi:MAG TPA: hypothetical protein VE029_03925 [Rhizobacter sp.]|nr:hypothetical protein [Rhizobacter sp.]